MKKYIFLFSFLFTLNSQSQEKINFNAIDSLYREDQFYVSITYNALQDLPSGLSQKKITPSFSFGFLRDMPINKKRTFAIATGLGYSINNYNENLLISIVNEKFVYNEIMPSVAYDKNKLIIHYLDWPIELRWRTSTPTNHKFYRIYSGFKASYLTYDQSKYVNGASEILVNNISDLNKLQYGVYVDLGYNALNFYFYYGLNPIFKSAKIDQRPIDMRNINFGLMFYIL